MEVILKLDEHEFQGGFEIVITSMTTLWIAWHEVLLPIINCM